MPIFGEIAVAKVSYYKKNKEIWKLLDEKMHIMKLLHYGANWIGEHYILP